MAGGVSHAVREQSHFKFGEINRLGSGGGTKPVNFFFGKNFSEIAKKFFRAFGPKIRGGSKNRKKRSFFGIKNVKNFESGIYSFFSQKFFNPPMRSKGHFALKCTFPMETIVNKKKRKFPKFPKFW